MGAQGNGVAPEESWAWPMPWPPAPGPSLAHQTRWPYSLVCSASPQGQVAFPSWLRTHLGSTPRAERGYPRVGSQGSGICDRGWEGAPWRGELSHTEQALRGQQCSDDLGFLPHMRKWRPRWGPSWGMHWAEFSAGPSSSLPMGSTEEVGVEGRLSPQENHPPSPGGLEKAGNTQWLSHTSDTSGFTRRPGLASRLSANCPHQCGRWERPGSYRPRASTLASCPHCSPRHFVQQCEDVQMGCPAPSGRARTLLLATAPHSLGPYLPLYTFILLTPKDM